jgi:hypothetical protein
VATVTCPVCLTPDVERGRTRDYGERRQYDCPQCGLFNITATALAVWHGRAADHPEQRAKLSHHLRKGSDANNPVTVNAADLDNLLAKPLPSPREQMALLLRMIGSRLGHDHYGSARFTDVDLRAAVATVGLSSIRSVHRLIAEAVQQGLLQKDIDVMDGSLSLSVTGAGWNRIEPIAGADASLDSSKNRSRPVPSWNAILGNRTEHNAQCYRSGR